MAPTYYNSGNRRVNVTGLSGKPLSRIKGFMDAGNVNRARQIAERKRTALIPKVTTPEAQATDQTNTNVQPLDTSNIAGATPSPTTGSANPDAMFPTTRMFEPQNYQGSPLYQFQVKAGQDQVAKSLAARGLTNSGAGIKEELNVPMMAAAQDTDRMTRLASENADRLYRYQSDEALRKERAGNDQWNRTYSLAQLMAQQSPWQGALNGLDNYATATGQKGQSQANFLKGQYKKIRAANGGRRVANIPIPLPSGPNNINTMPAEINANAAKNNGWWDLANQAIANLFK